MSHIYTLKIQRHYFSTSAKTIFKKSVNINKNAKLVRIVEIFFFYKKKKFH